MHNSALFPIVLSASTFLSYSALAACTANPDCAALGYTKTSCASGDLVIKCPFNTVKVQCIPQTCETIGKKTCGDICIKGNCCSNTDCAAGQNCHNHICSICANSPYSIGDVYCNADGIPIGVVGHITNSGKNGVVVALDTAYDDKTSSYIQWGCYGTDLSLTNYASSPAATSDFSGKSNTDVIASQCGNNTAAYYCKNTYSKGGVSGWYLPAFGELTAILECNFDIVNAGLSKISPENQVSLGNWYWSSSEADNRDAWVYGRGNVFYDYDKNSHGYVRCVLAF